jgi:hypothetical protein
MVDFNKFLVHFCSCAVKKKNKSEKPLVAAMEFHPRDPLNFQKILARTISTGHDS